MGKWLDGLVEMQNPAHGRVPVVPEGASVTSGTESGDELPETKALPAIADPSNSEVPKVPEAGVASGLPEAGSEPQAAVATAGSDPEQAESLAVLATERSQQLRLSDLFREQLVCRVHSRVLGEDVLFAADGADVPEDTDLVVYRGSELQGLVGRSPEQLCAVHAIKCDPEWEVVEAPPEDEERIWPGELLPDTSAGDLHHACGQRRWWTKPGGQRECAVCHPDPNATKERQPMGSGSDGDINGREGAALAAAELEGGGALA